MIVFAMSASSVVGQQLGRVLLKALAGASRRSTSRFVCAPTSARMPLSVVEVARRGLEVGGAQRVAVGGRAAAQVRGDVRSVSSSLPSPPAAAVAEQARDVGVDRDLDARADLARDVAPLSPA